MTPFGNLLRFYRQRRGLSQLDLARLLNADAKLISAVETGRRCPPEGNELERLFCALGLRADEQHQLTNAGRQSSFVIRVPRDTPPDDLEFIHTLVSSLRGLGADQRLAIRNALGDGRNR